MSGGTINTTLTTSITLGSSGYGTDVTLTNTGAVEVSTTSSGALIIAINVPAGILSATIVNDGTISSTTPYTMDGGIGIQIVSPATVDNQNLISASYFGILSDAGGLVNNSGDISSASLGVAFVNGGTLINSGTITASVCGVALNGASLTNTGKIAGSGIGVYANPTGLLTNRGDIYGTVGVSLVAGASVTNFGTIAALSTTGDAVYATGDIQLTVEPGAIFSGYVVDTSGQSQLILGGTTSARLDIANSFSGFSNISFAAGSDWILEGNAAGLASGQTISGFSFGDSIVLDGFAVNALDTTYVSGAGLELTSTTGSTITLDITGSFSTANFAVTDISGATSSEILLCYLRGTRIATPIGEIAIEHLKIGDPVMTRFNGYQRIKWIGRQSFAKRFILNNRDKIPVCISAGALGQDLPARDLFVSPGHSMLIGGILILASSLVNGITIHQDNVPDEVHYYQLEFETHDCVLAEGAWSESYADIPGFRNKFHNADEFYTLYPAHQALKPSPLCAPRPLEGPALDRALRPIVARAAAGVAFGNLRGCIDEITACGLIRGWAWDEKNPELPVPLEIVVCGRVIGKVLACEHREDLCAAGFGSGHCAFSFISPFGLPLGLAHDIQVRRAADGSQIFMTEACLAQLGIQGNTGTQKAA